MSSIRVTNIEAKADASSPTINEKVKITKSGGDVMLQLDGAAVGITTIGINTTGSTFTVDRNQGVVFAGIVTSIGGFSGNLTGNVTGNVTGNINSTGVTTVTRLNIGTGTSISSPATNVLTLGTNNVERVRIDSSGNLGIGTNNPNFPLDVLGRAQIGGSFYNSSVSLGVSGQGEAYNSNGAISVKNEYYNAGTIAGFTANTGSVNSACLFDFNAYNSTSGATDIYLGAVAGPTNNGPANFVVGRRTAVQSWAESLRVDTSGRLGIGTASPTHRLDILTTNIVSGLRVSSSNDWGDINTPMVDLDGNRFGNGDGNILRLRTGAARGDVEILDVQNGSGTQFVIKGSGNIGIGTDNPQAKLDIRGNNIRQQGTNPYVEFYQPSGTNTGYIQSRTTDFRFNSVGDIPVTIGPNDSERVRVSTGGTFFVGATSFGSPASIAAPTGKYSYFSGFYVGAVPDSVNNSSEFLPIHRLGQGQGSQFSGHLIVNSWTGQAYLNLNVSSVFTSDNIAWTIINATHNGHISKVTVQLVTATWNSESWWGFLKNGGGSGVFYMNAFVESNAAYYGRGMRAVTSGYTVTTTHATLNP